MHAGDCLQDESAYRKCLPTEVCLLASLAHILVPRGHNPFGQHQGSKPLVGPDFLRMQRGLVLYFKPIRFARFDKHNS